MKLEVAKNTVYSSKKFKKASYGIDEENIGMILHILRDQLYSDKISAIIREYSSNAADAHVEARIKEPIQVTLPTALDQTLRIRDFGKGLSPKDVEHTYIKLGKSTKRKTNRLNGCLGLGSKSGFAYTDSFTIVSHHAGIKTTYQAYIDSTKIDSYPYPSRRRARSQR